MVIFANFFICSTCKQTKDEAVSRDNINICLECCRDIVAAYARHKDTNEFQYKAKSVIFR